MKKVLIGSIVGGIIIFIWQFLSWTILDLHRPNQQYTPKQDTILAYLSSQFAEDGSYFLPNTPKNASQQEMEQVMQSYIGKPWAQIQYHKEMNMSMGGNMAKGLITNIIMLLFLCWILLKISPSNFGVIFTACLFTGMVVFLNSPYTIHIWYIKADIMAHFIDALVSWGLCGAWLGWWLNRLKY